ncbi:MAG: outer membrane lipoprotein carrier protein LolA [Candidatus Fermentibacteraceae bacterium]
MILLILLLALAEVPPEAPLAALNHRLQSVESLRGTFVRTDYLMLTMEADTTRGTFLLAPPNLFVLDFAEPEGRRIGFDGARSYTVEPATSQVIIYEDRRPDSFLGTLRSYDDSTMVDSVRVSGDSVLVRLEGAGSGVAAVRAGYTLSDSLPFLYATTDINGNTITYRLEGVRAGGPPPEGAFGLEVPEGYAVARP